MGQYKTQTGQNIYDVAIHIYGSLDGLIDLFVNNPDLSFSNTLRSGTLLNYTDGLFVDQNVVSTLIANSVVPSSGSANIHYQPDPSGCIADIICKPTTSVGALRMSGIGLLYIDWGDNSAYESVELTSEPKTYPHIFNSKIKQNRRVRLFGDVTLDEFDISGLEVLDVRFLKRVKVYKYTHGESPAPIEHVRLLDQVYSLSLKGAKTPDLSPVISCLDLMQLDLRGDGIKRDKIENYLIGLVANYSSRRGCTIHIDTDIQGSYQEPSRDEYQKYIIKSAMEAVWVLTNEPAWQEAGFWHIIINNQDYTTEP